MRSTSTASGPSAGTPTRARTCRTTTMTRKGQNSPPSGKRPTSCPASSSCSTSCTGKAWSSSAWRTAPRQRPAPPEPWPKKHQLCSKTSVVTHNAWQVLGSLRHPRTTHAFTSHRSVTPRCQIARGINHRRITALSFCSLLSSVLSLEASRLSVASIILPCMAAGRGSANNQPINEVHKYLNQSAALDSSVWRRFHWHNNRSPLQQQTDSIHRNHCLISGKELNPCLFCNQIWCLERGAVPPFRPFFLSPSRC